MIKMAFEPFKLSIRIEINSLSRFRANEIRLGKRK